MKTFCLLMAAAAVTGQEAQTQSKVFVTKNISPAGLTAVYEAVGVKATGRVAVKISTGEAGGGHYLKPELIGALIKKVNGTIVECNTAYGGSRMQTERHRQTIKNHGFDKIAKVDILDEEGEIKIPVKDKKHLQYNIVGSHIKNYDFLINLAHFKGHAMAGFGGVIKNQSIGIASSNGKAYIHTAGKTETTKGMWKKVRDTSQNDFLESMAASAQGVAELFGKNIVYINVMNNMSVDCDCDSSPAKPTIADYGILASTDPVALDAACIDIVYAMKAVKGSDPQPLINRINSMNGRHVVDYGEAIGLGGKSYSIVNIDK